MINENGNILPFGENVVVNIAIKSKKHLKKAKQGAVKRTNECMFVKNLATKSHIWSLKQVDIYSVNFT